MLPHKKPVMFRRLFYANPEKVTTLYAQLTGDVPVARTTDVGARVSGGVDLGARFEIAGSGGAQTQSDITLPALSMMLLAKLKRSRGYVSDASVHSQCKAITKTRGLGATFLTSIDGEYRIDRRATVTDWLEMLQKQEHVSLFLNDNDPRSIAFHRLGYPHGLWVGMATELIVESKGMTGHVPTVMRGTNGVLPLSVTGWLESSGYLNPILAYW